MTEAVIRTAATLARTAQAGKSLAFERAREQYGVEILRVQEISTASGVRPMPGQPAWAAGVVRLRGRGIPVVNLRRRLGLAGEQAPDRSCVVVVDVLSPGGIMPLGWSAAAAVIGHKTAAGARLLTGRCDPRPLGRERS